MGPNGFSASAAEFLGLRDGFPRGCSATTAEFPCRNVGGFSPFGFGASLLPDVGCSATTAEFLLFGVRGFFPFCCGASPLPFSAFLPAGGVRDFFPLGFGASLLPLF